MSELDELRKQKEKHEEETDRLEDEVDRLGFEIEEYREEIGGLNSELYQYRDGFALNVMVNQQKHDFLKENWDKITLENLEAIV